MGVPIRISENIYKQAQKTARAEFRSIPNQIEFWATIGKCALDNPDLPITRIKEMVTLKNQEQSASEGT